MKISIVGTGYVGLVSGTCFAEMGNHVVCVDIDKQKIEKLKQGIMPIYEPGLEELVVKNYQEKRLEFVTSLQELTIKPQAYFIAVGTPSDEDGSADLKYVLAAAKDIGGYMDEYAVIVDKSTVPVTTAEKVRDVIKRDGMILAVSEVVKPVAGEEVEHKTVRFRTIGDMTCTGAVESRAGTIAEIIQEVATVRVTERGGRADDRRSEAAMEDRKKQGYF